MSEPADSSEGIRLKALKNKLRLHLAKNGGQAPKEYDTPEELADMVREDRDDSNKHDRYEHINHSFLLQELPGPSDASTARTHPLL